MYSLLAIFAIVPLIFSHFFGRFGADFIIKNGIGNFESVKMHLFLILLTIATIELIWTRCDEMKVSLKKNGSLLLGSIAILALLGIFLYPHADLRDLFLGVGEKQHGLLFPIGLIWLGYLLSLLKEKERGTLIYTIIGGGIFIALVSIIEGVLRYNIFTGLTYSTVGSWGGIRATATLGNPNYVAGYLLMILPLTLSSIKRGEKYLILFILFLGILMTKSMIAIALTSGYILCMILSQFFGKKSLIILPFIVLVVLFATYGLTHESVKWLSLTSRFVLMKYTVIGSLDSFGNILFGHGPNGIVEVFSGVRPAEIDGYFPRESIIDSSHNIFIDIFACYGLLGLGGSLWYIIYRWRSLGTPSRAGVMLGILFLSLNVLVISHMMLLVFLLSQSSLKENSSH